MRRVDFGKLAQARAELGEVILDSSNWPSAMERICRAVNATGACLLQASERTEDVPRTESVGELLTDYFSNGWHTRDVRAQKAVPRLRAGEPVIIDQDIMTLAQIERDPLYNECCLPNKFRWFGVIKITAGAEIWGLSIQRTAKEGPFDAAEKEVLASLSRPLSETATLSMALGSAVLTSACDALGAVGQAAISINRHGAVLRSNNAAENIFDDDLCVKKQRLFVSDREANNSLCALFERLRVSADTESVGAEPILVRRVGKTPLVVNTLPIHGAARTPFLGARALLVLSSFDDKPGPAITLLTRAFGLTTAEARIGALIATGKSPDAIAAQLGVSRATARNQLKAVLAKTGTHRQGELVALLSQLRGRIIGT